MSTPAPRTWIYFLPQESFNSLSAEDIGKATKINRYTVDSSNTLRGMDVTDFKPSAEIVRVCSNEPIGACSHALAGCTQHLHYTSEFQRDRLLSISAKEIPASEKPVTVLIPIRKSDAWWNLGHNRRFDYMNGSSTHRGHTKIGEEYASLIFRQLMHSRYMDAAKRPYDFLTYFEFRDAERDWFKSLLRSLRDETINSEWAMVEMEQEIWMRKVE